MSIFGNDGMTMMLRNLIGEERMNDIFGTFDTIRNGVVAMGTAINAIGKEQIAARELATQRHEEILAMFKKLGVEPPAVSGSTETTTKQLTN